MNCKVVSRKNNFVVTKESEQISDLLNIIGAHNALLSLQNTKIVKAMRNNVNRIVIVKLQSFKNCKCICKTDRKY